MHTYLHISITSFFIGSRWVHIALSHLVLLADQIVLYVQVCIILFCSFLYVMFFISSTVRVLSAAINSGKCASCIPGFSLTQLGSCSCTRFLLSVFCLSVYQSVSLSVSFYIQLFLSLSHLFVSSSRICCLIISLTHSKYLFHSLSLMGFSHAPACFSLGYFGATEDSDCHWCCCGGGHALVNYCVYNGVTYFCYLFLSSTQI